MVRFLRVSWLAVTVGAMLLTTAGAALAIQPTVVQIEKNTDGTYTYHFKIKIDDSVTVESGKEAPSPDFFTIFNFDGFVPDSAKSPEGWTFSSSFRRGRRKDSPPLGPKASSAAVPREH
jgi:hypothetical protein